MTSLNDEPRRAALDADDKAAKAIEDARDALREWSKEIAAVNDRYFARAIDRIAAAKEAMGWPDHKTAKTGYAATPPGFMHYFLLVNATRDILKEACGLQTAVIDKVEEAVFASHRARGFGSAVPDRRGGEPNRGAISR